MSDRDDNSDLSSCSEQQQQQRCSSSHVETDGTATDVSKNNNSNNSAGFWSIGVKTVTTSVPAADFTVLVSPDDDLERLYREIETKTGLSASQQRLIYRGRLIEHNNNTGHDDDAKKTKSTKTNYGSQSADNKKAATKEAADSSTATDYSATTTPSSKKIKDIAGLTDGHTIHLVERKVQGGSSSSRSRDNHATSVDVSAAGGATTLDRQHQQQLLPSTSETNDTNDDSASPSSGAASLLAALLGIGTSEPGSSSSGPNGNNNNDDDEDDDAADTATAPSNNSRTRWRPRYASTRRRQLSYRLTEEDLQVPDPGSMESVRQGLMTLHTMLGPMTVPTANNSAVESSASRTAASSNHHSQQQQPMPMPTMAQCKSPLHAQRRFYEGQWIDVRDTVNQWLEATVVEIVLPEEILPPPMISNRRNKKNVPTVLLPATDPPVSASDFAGRRRLLLEPCSEEDHEPNLGIELDANGDPLYFRQRDSNTNVHLLLVHYNGWPHRWDEWIRSDSERIRPFRTRTRHPNNSNRISPTVQSTFSEAPSTYFLPNPRSHQEGHRLREHEDRLALLPELSRVLATVNGMLSYTASANGPVTNIPPTAGRSVNNTNLPWDTVSAPAERDNAIMEVDNEDDDQPHRETPSDQQDAAGLDDDQKIAPVTSTTRRVNARRRRQELEALAPLLDRLGRTLVDAAPHVAALAASIDQPQVEPSPSSRVRDPTNGNDDERQQRPSTLGGFLSLLSRDRSSRRSVGSSNAAILGNDSVSFANSHEQTTVASSTNREEDEECDDDSSDVQFDPDYTDFAAGLVNTTRGDVRGGSHRSSRQTSSGSTGDELAGLLGAYLAAASLGGLVSSGDDDDGDNTNASATAQGLGRLLRERGVGGNGIDIHIHAVVTAPGGNVGLATVGGGGLGTTLFQSSSRNSSSTGRNNVASPFQEPQLLQEDDDLGIFAELYSETPDPIDPSSPTAPSSPVRSNGMDSPISALDNIEPTAAVVHGDNMISASAHNRSTDMLSTPSMFSRSSRRSGFVSNSGGSTSTVTNSNNVNTISTNNPINEATVSSIGRSSATTSGPTTSRPHRGSVLSRFFRRNQDNNSNN